MRNIILLTDLLPASLHTASYAAGLTKHFKSSRLILCHVHIHTGSTAGDGLEQLKRLHSKLLTSVSPDISIRYRAESGEPAAIINQVVADEDADMVVMGLREQASPDNGPTAGVSLSIIDTCHIPVLLLPPDAVVEPVVKIVFLCDLKDMQDTIEQSGLMAVMAKLQASNIVLHIELPGQGLSPETIKQLPVVQEMLSRFRPEYFYLESTDPALTINRFVLEQQVSMVLVVRKRQSLFSQSYQDSFTRQLALKTTVPLLILHATKHHAVRKI